MLRLFAPLLVLGLLLGGSGRAFPGGPGGGVSSSCNAVTVSYGTVFKYNVGPPGYPSQYINSDIWANTWADDNGYYAVNDDSVAGWQAATAGGSNMQISKLSTTTTAMVGTNVNTMLPQWGWFGTTGSDGLTFKAAGIISVGGVLYVPVFRQTPAFDASNLLYTSNMQLIKSSNHGTSWSPVPPGTVASAPNPYATTMFSGGVNTDPIFVQYGKDYQGQTDSNSSVYVYGTVTDPVNTGSRIYLTRVPIANIGNQSAGDWSYYIGGDGMQSGAWSTTWANAVPIIQTRPYGVGYLSGAQYFPKLGTTGCYIYINWWYPSGGPGTLDTTTTQWQTYAAARPWGPWAAIEPPKTWTGAGHAGLYAPNIMPASVAQAGNVATATVLTAGDWHQTTATNGDYTLTIIPLTLTQN